MAVDQNLDRAGSVKSSGYNLVMFILISSALLLIPPEFLRFKLSVLAVLVIFIVKNVYSSVCRDDRYRTYQYLLFCYLVLIFISSAFHFAGLSRLEESAYITVSQHDAAWGIRYLLYASAVYSLFPVLLIVSITFFKAKVNYYKWLLFLPIIFVPSLIVAFYQGFVDIEFLNSVFGIQGYRTSGLSTDFNGFGFSSYLIVTISVLGIVIERDWWKKAIFLVLAVTSLLGLFLSGSRTGFLGITMFGIMLPLIWAWVNVRNRKRWWYLVIVYGAVGIALAGAFKADNFGGGTLNSLKLVERIQSSYCEFKKSGIAGAARGRLEMALQAWRLTRLSFISGWGPGGFWRNIDNIRFMNGEKPGCFDNANNHYLQMSSELGFAGAFLNFLLHIIPLWMVFRIRKQIHNLRERWIVGISFTTISIMMLLYMTGPHTMCLDVLWIIELLLSVIFVTALKYGYSFKKTNSKLYFIILGLILVFFFWGAYENTVGKYGYLYRQQNEWWSPENDRPGPREKGATGERPTKSVR
ncbi:MAG TPA: O-antigen ligase family protein [Desulfobacteraceae bacterium]|nr:O-antigen ligase family protein [Desulfobacteraceae bacterium]HPJ66349.1 O-antigen ligase family protein [Desulfobacteraceae bacterium]HPQ27193.1 O-antigen ligase family protein [Desulfobacteraceae bacterium]